MRNELMNYGFNTEMNFLDRSAQSAAATTGAASVAPGMMPWQDARDLAFSAR